jgi:hypothetical protein
LQAGPKINRAEEESQEDEYIRASLKPFQTKGLDLLAFPDYSEEYPHMEWTLGFAGRPGGPDFYINLDDNTELHGPGGQYQHALEEQGDSCFGRIKTGQEFIQQLENHPVMEDGTDWDGFFIDPVRIVGAVVLTKNPQKGRRPQPIPHEDALTPLVINDEELGQTTIVDDTPFGDALPLTRDDASSPMN